MNRIIQLSTRVNEGGAARVALDIHNSAADSGWDSYYFYGYGRRALRSESEKNDPYRFCGVNSPFRALVNRMAYSVLNRDIIPPRPVWVQRFKAIAQSTAVIHIHGLHSYYMPISFFEQLIRDNKAKVVFTLHDQWILTGRCAFAEDCDKWKGGCGACPKLSNYPPVLLDRSQQERVAKQNFIDRYKERIVFTSPSRYLAANARMAYPWARIETIPNSCAADFSLVEHQPSSYFSIVAIAADLSDEGKVPISFINMLSEIGGVRVYLIGRNLPKMVSNRVDYLGEFNTRAGLASALRGMDALLFLSVKDIFPLVLIEGLVAGLEPLCVESEASVDVLSYVGIRPFRRVFDIVQHVKARVVSREPVEARRARQLRSTEVFDSKRNMARYYELYESFI